MQAVHDIWCGRGRLENLVAELDRQKASKLDFVADARSLAVVSGDDGLYLEPASPVAGEWLSQEGLRISDHALPQFGGRVKPEIPTKFLRDLASQQPAIAGDLVNGLFQAGAARHLVRCLDGRVRALLSNSYRVLDHFDLAFSALDTVREAGGEIIECSLSDTHLRLKFTSRGVWDAIAEVKGGDGNHAWLKRTGNELPGRDLPGGPGTVHPVVTVSNSETGHGGLHVRIGILRALCFNASIIEDVASQVHLGSKLEIGVYSEETIAADSKAVLLKCRDSIKAAFEPAHFKRLVDKAHRAASDKIEAPQPAVANIVDAGGLTDQAKDSILAYFLRDYDQTRYGLSQAVSRYAQDLDDGDQAFDVESLAGRVIAEPALVAV